MGSSSPPASSTGPTPTLTWTAVPPQNVVALEKLKRKDVGMNTEVRDLSHKQESDE